jgi:hypothetical protein
VVSDIFVRALSFFGPGELRALRLEDAGFFRLVVSTLRAPETATQAAQALDSLCAVALATSSHDPEDETYAATIIEHCAATVTELSGYLPGPLLCDTDPWAKLPVLARCTRLEVLTFASSYMPAFWLGLSQLHTLRDVDLSLVSAAAIAAALPRLRTLTTVLSSFVGDVATVEGFFTDLLPRLRVFHFFGTWPTEDATAAAAPLPQLEELEWYERSTELPTRQRMGFLGAQPIVVHAPFDLIAECLPSRNGIPGEPASSFLSRVREFHVSSYAPVAVSDIARVLRVAPRLRTLSCTRELRGDTSFLAEVARPLHPSFVGLVHPRLRLLSVSTRVPPSPRDDGCASRLRQTCLPRLRMMRVNCGTYFVTPDATGRHQIPDE